jgi:Beta-ketoacyl synthase, N-terminal domain
LRAAIIGAARILPPEGERVCGELPFKEWLPSGHLRRMGRASRLAYLAAARALEGASVEGDVSDLAVVVGTALGEVGFTLKILGDVLSSRCRQVGALKVPGSVHNALAGYLSVAKGLTAPTLTVSSGRLSGEAALAVAMDLLTAGAARRALVVAADEFDPAWIEALEREGATEWASLLSADTLVEGSAALVLDPSPAEEPELGWIEEAGVQAGMDELEREPSPSVLCRAGAEGIRLRDQLGERSRLISGPEGRTLAGALPLLTQPPEEAAVLILGRDRGITGYVRWAGPEPVVRDVADSAG